MISRSYRIQTKEFPGVTRGKIFSDDVIRVSIKKDDLLIQPRCAVIVSQKIAKKAVIRNRMRRKIYAWVREHLGQVPVAYICVYPKNSEISTQELYESLNKFLCVK